MDVNKKIYFETYKDEIPDKIYTIDIKLHHKDRELSLKPENISTKLSKEMDEFKIIHDEYNFFKVSNTNINLYDTFKKLKKNDYKQFYKMEATEPSPDVMPSTVEEIMNKKQSKLNISWYIIYLYSFCRAFYSLKLKYYDDTKGTSSQEPRDNAFAKNLFGLQIVNYKYEQEKKLNPDNLKNITNADIEKNYKEKFYETDELIDDMADIVTYNNIFNLFQILLNKGKKLEFTEDGKRIAYEIKNVLKLENLSKYKKKIRIDKNAKKITMHFDIELEELRDIEYLQIFLDLKGDISEKKVVYLPKFTDPSYEKAQRIFTTTKYRIFDRFLHLAKFNSITDKNLFFLDSDYFVELLKTLEANKLKLLKLDDPNKTIQEKNKEKEDKIKENIKHNIDLFINIFFKKSKDPEHKGSGHFNYKEKEYLISGVSDIDFNYDAPNSDKHYEKIDVSYSDISIDITSSNLTLSKLDNVYYQDNSVNVVDICNKFFL